MVQGERGRRPAQPAHDPGLDPGGRPARRAAGAVWAGAVPHGEALHMPLADMQALLLWGLVGGWLVPSSRALKHMMRRCAMRMPQAYATTMMHKALAQGRLAGHVTSTSAVCARQQSPVSVTLLPAGSGALAGAGGPATESWRCTNTASATAGLWGAGAHAQGSWRRHYHCHALSGTWPGPAAGAVQGGQEW